MILTDTGPLVAIVDPADSYHIRSREVVDSLAGEVWLTTWPCFTEAMYFLGESGGFRYQTVLWDRHRNGQLQIHPLTGAETDRIEALMSRYQGTPIGLADASLIAVVVGGDRQPLISIALTATSILGMAFGIQMTVANVWPLLKSQI